VSRDSQQDKQGRASPAGAVLPPAAKEQEIWGQPSAAPAQGTGHILEMSTGRGWARMPACELGLDPCDPWPGTQV